MWAALTVAVLGLLPHDSLVVEHVDRIEVNHVFDSAGHLVLDQEAPAIRQVRGSVDAADAGEEDDR